MQCSSERLVGDVTILDLASRAMLGEISTEVTDRVQHLVGQGRRAFVLNMAAVSTLDSAGLGDLVGAYKMAARKGATLKLLHLNERIADLLRVVSLLKLFETFDSEADAVGSFGA